MILPFGEWTPDIDSLSVKGLTVAENCVPAADGYLPLNSLSDVTDALTGACIGAAWFADKTGTVRVYAGDATKLYRLSGATWSNVSKSGNYTGGTNWEFVLWGDRCIAVDPSINPQYFDMSSGTLFADLPGSPPKASRIAVVGDFIVLGDLENKPNWVRWSGFNSSELWTASMATQSDSQELFGRGGRVQKIISGSVGVIFQEHSIRVMTYEGPPRIFRIDEVEVDSGTPAGNSVVPVGSRIFYYGWDGFRVFSVGGGSQSISDNRVTEWLKSNCPDVTTIRGVADREAQRVIWSFSTGSSTADRVIIYDWSINRWSYGRVDTEILFEFSSPGYTIDSMDTIMPDIDAATLSLDDRFWLGGAISVGAFTTAHKAATFTGSELTATLETGEMQAERRLFINKMRPLVTGYGSMTAQIASRSTLASPATFGPASTLNSSGEFTTRANSRYHTFRVTISGGFDRAMGLDVNAVPEGNR